MHGYGAAVHGDDGDAGALAVAFQHAVRGGVVDLPLHENRLIVGKPFGEFGKLDDQLPIELHLAHGRRFFVGTKPVPVL